MKDREIPKQYISLEEASKLGAYSQEYLSLRARQKKLQAVKIGRNWVTTKEWFYEYVGNAEEFKNNVKNGNGNHKHVEAPANLPIEDLFKERQILLQKSIPLMRLVMVSALVILTATGIALGKDGLAEAYQKANQKVQEFAAGFDKGIQDSFKTVSLRVEQFSEGFDAGLPLALRSVGNFTQEFSQGFDSGFPSAMRTLESGASQFAEGFDYGIRSPAAVERFVSDLPASISDAYFRANQFVEQRLKKDFNSLARGYENINNAAERSIAKSVSRMQDGVQEFKEGLAQGLKTFSFIKVPSAQKENVAVVPETVKEEKSIQGEQASSRTAEAVQRETVRTVVAVDNKELNELRSQVQGILIWKGDIDEFRRIASKLQSSPPSSYAVNAPVYIGSSGVQVAGSVSAGSVGAAFGGVKDLGVGLSATIGETNNSASKFTVNAESFFNSPVKLTSSFNVGTSALNNLTVDTSGNLETKGTVKVLNSSDVAQVTLDASGNITITGTLTAQGGSSISGGTTELSALSVTGNTILGNEAADTIQFGASTLALPNSLNIDSGTLYIDASNNRIGLGTASPARIMDLFGAGPQLRLSADSSNYTDISHASTGFFTINTTGFGIGLADGLSIGSSYISTTPPSDGLIVQGNTGIGTTAPDAALEINHATGDNLRLTYNDSNGSAVSYTDFATGSDGALTVTSTGLINLQGVGSVAVNDSGSDVDFRVEGVGAANALFVQGSDGFIGIGTATPARRLDVFGSGPQLRLSADSSNYTDVSHAGAGFFTIDTTGFGVGFADGVGIGSTYSTTTPPSDGLIVQGNTGIGTTSPNNRLEVLSTTTPQVRVAYDTSNYVTQAVSTTGAVTFDATGAGAAFTFSDAISVSSTLSVTGATTMSSDLAVVGNTILDGSLTVGGIITSNGNVTLGSTAANTITFTGVVSSNIVADASSTRNLGSSSVRWATGYFDTVDATNLSGTVTGGSTTSATWTINSDNTTANAQISALAFETGSATFNAALQWNALGDAGRVSGYDDNILSNYPISIFSQVSGGNQTFTSGSLFNYGQNATHAITQTGAFVGLDMDFSSNITVPNSSSGNQTGALITLKDGGASATSIGFQTAGTLDYGIDLAGTIGTAEIRLSNGEVITNTTNGVVSLGDGTSTHHIFSMNTGEAVVFNETGADIDFRVEGVGQANALVVQGSDGFVGIGVAAPTYPLEVNGSSDPDALFGTTSGNNFEIRSGGKTVNMKNLTRTWNMQWDNSPDYLRFSDGTNDNLVLAGGGNAGIGTATPARLLDVFGSGPQLRLSADSSNYTDVSHAGTGFFTIDTTGFGVGFADGVGIGSTYSTTTPPSDGLIVQGNTGIGTTAPDAALEINHATGDSLRLTYGDGDGSAANYTDLSLSSTGALTLTGSAASIASAVGAEKTFLTLTPGTITLTGTTQITSLMETAVLTGATIAGDTATVTVDKATALSLVAPIDSTNVTLTDSSALRVLNTTSGAGTLTSQYGLYIESLTAGTNDYGIYIAGADTAAIQVVDNSLIRLGTDGDAVLVLDSAGLAADAELTNVIEGTSDTLGTAANSLLISNITNDGDIAVLVSKAGNSYTAFWADGSTGDTALMAATGQSVDIYIAGTKEIDYATGAMAFQQATIISSTSTLAINAVTSLTLNSTTADVNLVVQTDANANALVLDAGLFAGVGQLSIGSAAQGTVTAFAVIDNPAITATSNQDFYKLLIDNSAAVTITGATTSPIVASLAIEEPNITATGTVTNAATLYIKDAPTEGGTGNYALWVAAGDARFDAGLLGMTTGGVGNGTSIQSSIVWHVNTSQTDSASMSGIESRLTNTQNTGATSNRFTAIMGVLALNGAQDYTKTDGGAQDILAAGDFDLRWGGTGTLSEAVGIRAGFRKFSTGPVILGEAIRVSGWGNQNATNAITSLYGLHITNPGYTTGTITTLAGIYIDALTAGGTNDYGIYIAGADTAAIQVVDNSLIRLGTDGDAVLVLDSAGLAADAELTNVIEGTSDTLGTAANSLLISNITNDGDIAVLVSKAGNSYTAFWADGSTGDTALMAATGQSVDTYIAGTKWLDVAASAIAFSGASGTTNTSLTITNTSNTAATAEHSIVDIAVGGTTTIGDPQVRWTIPSGTSWYAGADNSSNDQFHIGTGTAVGTSSVFRLDGRTSGSASLARIYVPALNMTLTDDNNAVFNTLYLAGVTATLAGTTQVVSSDMSNVVIGRLTVAQSGGAVTVDSIEGLGIYIPTVSTSVTATAVSGARIIDAGTVTGTMANQYGLYVEALTAGASDYGIYIAGADTYALFVDAGASRFDGDVSFLTPAADATGVDIVLGADNATPIDIGADVFASGTLIDLAYDTAEVLTGDVAGLSLNLNTNVTGVADGDLVGFRTQTPALTSSGTTTTNYRGFQISAAGALDTTVEAAQVTAVNWYGLDIQMPNIDTGEAGDTTTSYGMYIRGGTTTNGAGTENQYGLIVDSAAGNVGIGTTAPTQLLHVYSAAGTNPRILVESDASSSTSEINLFAENASGAEFQGSIFADGTNTQIGFYTRLVGADGGSTKLVLTNAGTLVLGSGENGTTAATGNTFRAPNITTGGAGNIAGADLTIAAGLGTGTGDVGQIIFSLPIVAGAGDFIQTTASRLVMDMAGSSTDLTFGFQQATTVSAAGNLTLSASAGNDVLIGDDSTILYVDGGTGTVSIGITAEASVGFYDVFAFGEMGAGSIYGEAVIASGHETGASTAQQIIGIQGTAKTTASNTQAWTAAVGLRAFESNMSTNGGSGAITGAAGYYVTAASVSGATITNQYGLYVEALTAGTNNYGIYINTPTGTIAEAIHAAGNINLTYAAGTGNATLNVTNSTNTAVAAHSIVDIAVGGTTSTGDPQVRWTIPSGTSWYAGLDNSDVDRWMLGVGTAVGTTPAISVRGTSTAGTNVIELKSPYSTSQQNTAGQAFQFLFIDSPEALYLNTGSPFTALQSAVAIDPLPVGAVGGASTINKASGLTVQSPYTAEVSTTLTDGSAIRVLDTTAQVATQTNQYGLYIEALTAATNNYGLYINTPTGTIAEAIHTEGGIARFNASGDASSDFIVQGDTNTNLIMADASIDAIGFGTTPTATKDEFLRVGGTWAANTGRTPKMVLVNGTLTIPQDSQAYMLNVGGTFTEAGAGTHAALYNANFAIPTVTGAGAAVTNTANVYIEGAMSATVTGANYALLVAAGTSRFDGLMILGSGENGTTAATGNTFRAPNITTGGAGNIAGADLTIAAGLGTGTGDPGQIIFNIPLVAATGDIIQTLTSGLILDTQGIVFNEDSADIDFRVESNDNTSAFVIDGGSNVAAFFDSVNEADQVRIASTLTSNDSDILNLARDVTLTADRTTRGLRVDQYIDNATGAVSGDNTLIFLGGGIGGANTQNWTATIGASGVYSRVGVQTGAAGTITGLAGFISDPDYGVGTATVQNYYHFRANNVSTNTATTNQYGLYIANLTSASNDYGIYIVGADTYALWVDAGVTRLDGTTYIGDSANTSSTLGLTINQGAADDAILSLKSSDIAHGNTSLVMETDTFADFRKLGATTGGTIFSTVSTGSETFRLRALGTTDDTTKSTAAVAYITLQALKANGASDQDPGANANLVAITLGSSGTTRFIFDTEGTGHADDVWTDNAYDLAEEYDVAGQVEEGDVLVFDATERDRLAKSQGAYANVAGVISYHTAQLGSSFGNIREKYPQLNLRDNYANPQPVALVGRVPVKVTLENGPIAIGDPIASSSTPGAAMRATQAGRVIGFALDSFNEASSKDANGVGRILAFVNPHWQGGDLSVQQTTDGQILNTDPEQLRIGLASLGLAVNSIGTLEVDTLIARKARLQRLELVDQRSGEIFCTWLEYGEWMKVIGECDTIEITGSSGNASGSSEPLAPVQDNASSDSGTVTFDSSSGTEDTSTTLNDTVSSASSSDTTTPSEDGTTITGTVSPSSDGISP